MPPFRASMHSSFTASDDRNKTDSDREQTENEESEGLHWLDASSSSTSRVISKIGGRGDWQPATAHLESIALGHRRLTGHSDILSHARISSGASEVEVPTPP